MRITAQHLNADLHAAWREIDALVVAAMVRAEAQDLGGRESLVHSGLLDPALTILWHARTEHKFKGCTLSVLDAAQARCIAP